MIVPSKALESYIEAFDSRGEFCRKFNIESSTVARYLDRKQTCASSFIEKVKELTGMDFEKAFEIVEDEEDAA